MSKLFQETAYEFIAHGKFPFRSYVAPFICQYSFETRRRDI